MKPEDLSTDIREMKQEIEPMKDSIHILSQIIEVQSARIDEITKTLKTMTMGMGLSALIDGYNHRKIK